MQGLNQPEMRLLAEKVSDQPETWDIEDKLVEFSLPSWQVMTQSQSSTQFFVNLFSEIWGSSKNSYFQSLQEMHKTNVIEFLDTNFDLRKHSL